MVESNTTGLELQSYPTVDGRVAADITLQELEVASINLLAEGDKAMSILEATYNDALLGLTAEMVGAMDVLLQATVDYTKERKQFGTAISKFQVLQHHMADMFMAAELARSLMYAAPLKCVTVQRMLPLLWLQQKPRPISAPSRLRTAPYSCMGVLPQQKS